MKRLTPLEGYLDDSFHRKGMNIWIHLDGVASGWCGLFGKEIPFSKARITSNSRAWMSSVDAIHLTLSAWMFWVRPKGIHVKWSRGLLETHTGSPANIPNFRWDLLVLVPSLEYHFQRFMRFFTNHRTHLRNLKKQGIKPDINYHLSIFIIQKHITKTSDVPSLTWFSANGPQKLRSLTFVLLLMVQQSG